MLIFFVIYLLCGMIIGFFAGLFGIGGGIIAIPALLILFNLQKMPQDIAMHMAVGTSLTIVIVTSIVAIFSHYPRKTIQLPVFKKIIPGVLIGSAIGIFISTHLQSIHLQRLFALFLLLIALQMFFSLKIQPEKALPKTRNIFFTSTLLATLSGMLGLGGGILIVPFLNWCGVSIRNAIGTSAACVLPAAIVGALGSVIFGPPSHNITIHSGYIYWPAFLGFSITSILFTPLGVKVGHLISTSLLKKSFALFLLVIGLAMLVRGI